MKREHAFSLFVLLLYFFQTLNLNAQCPPAGFPPMGGDCSTAPVVCEDLDGFCGTLGFDDNPQIFPGCPNNVLNNDDWLSFYADTTFIAILITPTNCFSGPNLGMQGAIYDSSCSGFAMSTQCNCTEAPFILSSSDFVVGQLYQLMLDGCAGSFCDYDIEILTGSTTAPPAAAPDINGPSNVCFGSVNTYHTNSTNLIEWSVSDSSVAQIIGANEGSAIAVQWISEGAVEICATASNFCDTAEATTCLSVVSESIDTTTLFYEKCPFSCVTCAGQTFCMPGTYEIALTATNGCDSVIICVVNDLPVNTPIDLGQVELCGPATFEICPGTILFDSGIYTLTCQDSLGCDIQVSVNLAIFNPEADIAPPPLLPENGTVLLNGTASAFNGMAPGATTSFSWTGPGITSLANDAFIFVDIPGTYCLTVAMQRNGTECSDTVCVEVLSSGCALPNPPIINGADTVCPGDVRKYTVTADSLPNPDTLIWVNGDLPFSLIHPDTIQVQWDSIGIFNLGAIAQDSCGQSDTTFFEVSVFDVPQVQDDQVFFICPGDSIDLDAGAGFASYSWSNGDTAQIISLSGPGQFFVTVTNGAGCTAEIAITALQAPSPTSILPPEVGSCEGETLFLKALQGFDHYLWNTGDTTVGIFIDSSGLYSVTVTSSEGCTYTGSSDVAIYTVTPFDLGPDFSICAGDTAVLDAGPGHDFYEWNSGENTQTIEVTEAGNYSVLETTPEGCTASDEINIDFFPQPQIDLGPDTSICSTGLPYDLMPDSSFSSYLWQDNSTATTYTITDTGFYEITLIVADTNGCQGFDTVIIDAQICNAVFENKLKGELTFQPNPAQDFTQLIFTDFDLGFYEMEIFDTNGKMIQSSSLAILAKKQTHPVGLKDFSKGIYFVKIFSENGMTVKRLIIQ
ncbi:MAG: T9SS type A sorting domain-containing protein [Bacteroidota bacterium]